MKLLRAIRDNRRARCFITASLIVTALAVNNAIVTFFIILLIVLTYKYKPPEPSTFIAAERVTLVLGHIDLSNWSDPIELNKGDRVLVCVDFEYNDGRMCKCYLTPRSGSPISVKADRAEGADNDA